MRSAAVLALALAAFAARSAVAQNACKHSFSNATFSLLPLKLTTEYRVFDDRNNPGSDNHTYYFNICDNVNDPLVVGAGASTHCNTTTDTGGSLPWPSNSWPSPAFRVSNRLIPPVCHRLGRDVNVAGNEIWTPLDNTNPARGVVLRYGNGDKCNDGVRRRSLAIHLSCYDDADNIPDTETVLSTDDCHFDIFIDSSFGCPTECPLANRQLCNGHGLCDYDTSLGKPRCFCFQGWSGADCTTAGDGSTPGMSAAGMVLIVVSVLLLALLVVLYFLWSKIRSLRLDPTAYKSLTGGPEGEPTGIYDD